MARYLAPLALALLGGLAACDGGNPASSTCGDGVVDDGEACDDGNAADGDGCSAACQPGGTCGDGIVDDGEACDDGNAAGGDGCDSGCTVGHVACGDGDLDDGEACDDGNAIEGDGCSASCVVELCGDGELDADEGCDDGNEVDGDGCDAGCVATGCGNGVVTAGEACDDGNWTSGDGCTTGCVVEFCGDGEINDVDEACDDGGTADGDCCSAACAIEPTCEREPNDALTAPNALAEIGVDGVVQGFVDPVGDRDTYLIHAPATATNWRLEVAVVDGPLGTTCLSNQLDSELELFDDDGALLAGDDGNGDGLCSLLVTGVAPGKYFLTMRASDFAFVETFDYRLEVALTPVVCGDGVVEVGETCDDGDTESGDGCDANCRPTGCGNGAVTAGEVCDDGDLVSGDGCDANCTPTACGNGVRTGAEGCDDGGTAADDGCSTTCQLETPCGNGVLDGDEACDDGGIADGDGCSFPECAAEPGHLFESEPNDGPADADPVPALAPAVVVHASIDPIADGDRYVFTIDAPADVRLETFDGAPGLTTCVGTDTVLQLTRPDGSTVSDDQGGINSCSLLTLAALPPGQYEARVTDFLDNGLISAYQLRIAITAQCGNGAVESAEECDGGAGCDAACQRIPACGDGHVDAPETCDDGGEVDGDGCSAECDVEGLTAEVEPNDTTADADARALDPAPLLVTGTTGLVGSITDGTDERDTFRLELSATTVVRLESFDGAIQDCGATATALRLLDAAGVQRSFDSTSGIGNCSALVVVLPAGTYYVQLEESGANGSIVQYRLDLVVQADAGAETEDNDTFDDAIDLAGADVVVLGDHAENADSDFYAITVPAGASIRAEVIEGDGETCESNGIDSRLTLHRLVGEDAIATLVDDDDDGRGFCSKIDGTGSAPADAAAHGLAAGTYFLEVRASTFATTGAGGQFVYRLQVTTRTP